MPRFGLEIILMLDKHERKGLFDASKSRFPFIISLFTFVEMPFMLYMFLCIIDQNLIQRMNMMVVARVLGNKLYVSTNTKNKSYMQSSHCHS